MITQKQLKELFNCRKDGRLIRRANYGTEKIGDVAYYVTDMYCFYHITKEQFISVKEGLYCLHDLGENTVYDTGVSKALRMAIIKFPGDSISDFVMVPMDNTFNIDFTRAIDANRCY